MDLNSKKTALIILGATAIICSRLLFFLFNDPEGPDLLIVVGLAMAFYFLSVAIYTFTPAAIRSIKRLLMAICTQVLSAIVLWFLMK